MTDINRKSLFALFATTLMVLSVCAVLIAYENPVEAGNDEIECNSPVNVTYNGSSWSATIPDAIKSVVTLENDTLILNSANFCVKSSNDAAISISGNSTDNPQPFKIRFTGINTVINQPTTSVTDVYGIKVQNVNLTITGGTDIPDSLEIATKKTDSTSFVDSIGIGITQDVTSSVCPLTFDSATVSIIPCDATTMAYGIAFETSDVILKNYSYIQIFDPTEGKKIKYSNSANGVFCKNLTLENKSELSIEMEAINYTLGIRVDGTFKMMDSSVIIKSNKSDGILTTTENLADIDNSTVDIQVTNNALIADSPSEPKPWNVSAFKNMTIKGCTSGGVPTTITGTTIPVEFGSIEGKPIKKFTVTFDLNGATSGTAPTMPAVGEGLTITLPATDAKKDGYTFAGWKCSLDNKVYQPGNTSPAITDNVTFTAEWKENSSGGNDNTMIIICAVLAIIILVGCGTYAYFKKFKQ